MTDRKLHELLSICRRLIEDSVLLDEEVHTLNRWLQGNPQTASRFPGQQVAARLKRIYADGVVTDEERNELLHLLRKATRYPGKSAESSTPAPELPCDVPPPEVHFMNRHFCLAGKFYCGSAKWCKNQIETRGGEVDEKPGTSTHYLVIGGAAGNDPKIREMASLRRELLKVISEDHWLKFLK